uniref:Matrix Gla protein n=1 Tax=Gallus gallus TaxID=9031 RepID=A0A8V0YDZ0_CHICK
MCRQEGSLFWKRKLVSQEKHVRVESHLGTNPFLNRQRANGFIRDDTGLRAVLQERIRERNKAPQERQREICEDFHLCEQYALNHGYPAAYRHYFGRRRNK